MKRQRKGLILLMIISLIAGSLTFSLPAMAADGNLVINGDFQTDSESDWKPDSWTVSSEIEPYTWINGDSAKVLQVKTSGTESTGTLSQDITGSGEGLAEGLYTLEAKLQGDSALLDSVKLFVKDSESDTVMGQELTGSITTADALVFRLENVPVVSEVCTIGLQVDLKSAPAWTWALDIDDVTFVKTGEINYAQNSGFEVVNGSWKPDGWTISEGLSDYFWSDGSGYRSGAQGLKAGWTQSAGSDPSGTVSRTVTEDATGRDLPDGVYTLEVWAKYTNPDKDGLNAIKLFAKDTGSSDLSSENLLSELSSDAHILLRLENIEVRGGSCTIGLEFDLKVYGGEIITMDDLAFYKTSELVGPPPTVVSIEPVSMTHAIGQTPALPNTVTAIMTNNSQKVLSVSWSAVPESVYTDPISIGQSFIIEGTVEGTDIRARVQITVTYKEMDFNHDLVIDVGDLAMAAFYYGQAEDGDLWTQASIFDINNDRIVDAVDLGVLSEEIVK